jgi:MFS family permease
VNLHSAGLSIDPVTKDPEFGPRHRWVVLAVGVAAQAAFSAAITGIPVTGATMRSDYQLGNSQLGLVLGSIYLGIAASEITWGLWTDRWGERKILLTGLISTATLLITLGVFVVPANGAIPGLTWLVLGMLLLGILGGSVNGSSGRAVMMWFRDGQRGFAMSIRQTAMPAGGAIGTLILPPLARTYGFRPVFGTLALLCIAAAIAAWRWLYSPAGQPHQAAVASDTTQPSPLRRRDIWRLAVASGLLTMPQIAVLTFAGIYLYDVHQAPLPVVVATLLVTQIGGGVARIWSGRYTDRHNNRRQLIRIIGAAAGGGLLLAGAATSAPLVVVAVLLALAGLLANAWHGIAYTEIASMAGANRAGTALGLENTTVFGAGFLTPLLIPVILTLTSWSVVWVIIGLMSLLAIPISPKPLKVSS